MRNFGLKIAALGIGICLAALCLCGPAAAGEKLNKTYAAEIDFAEDVGRIIYDKDIAAWKATDKMLAELGDDASGLPIRGWITDKDDKKWRVNFIGEKDGAPRVYYAAWVKGKKVKSTETYKDGLALTDAQGAMWRARKLAMTSGFAACSERYNTIVIPVNEATGNDDDTGMYVFTFASTTDPKLVMLGGHHRFRVSDDGNSIEDKTAFSNSCLALDKSSVPKGSTVAGLVASHIRTAYPQEHHVFAALSHGLNLYISTVENEAVWSIQNGKIRLVKTD